ncbi:MAG: DUF1353 domain-containing protein [Candidatus Omnitrophica bacterium]|nr:DUF1353 domain-containing protein [Candidatus Omnitrophota bacterium]
MSKFLTELSANLKSNSDTIWVIDKPLRYKSDLLGCIVDVQPGFNTDYASVPRIPIAFTLFASKTHREPVIHDYLYRRDSIPVVSFSVANKVFLEAMTAQGKGFFTRWAMYIGVCVGGYFSFHKKKVTDQI